MSAMLERGAMIEIRLASLHQLFNSFDPSPFHERDLDQDAEDYIVESSDEFPLLTPLTLVIHLPADQVPSDTFNLPLAIHNYFAYRLSESRRRLRFFLRDGRSSWGPERVGDRRRRLAHHRLGGHVAAVGDLSLRLATASPPLPAARQTVRDSGRRLSSYIGVAGR
jgi:hypothetical protein